MSTKLSFRARALDPSKPMPIYFAEELPDLQEYSAINRAVPQMPSGMEKEEESEHHLQRAIIAGLIIPTPEVADVKDDAFYDKIYPADYKMPRQMIHVQPLSLEQDIPDYDMDSADEMWFDSQTKNELTPFKFEQMMDRLEKITVCSLDDAKALVKRNEVNQDVFDYWVNKRLKTKHPLILAVKTEHRGNTPSNNPYIAFRRRTEKMQTRKNRKNDETSYEKMLKLRRDLSRAVELLEMVKRREKTKREELQLSIEIYEKRYQAKDFSGQLLAEYTSAATKLRPAFAPLYSHQYHHQHSSSLASSQHNQWNSSSQNYQNLHVNHHLQNNKRDFDGLSTSSSRKEKRQYKKRKHKAPREVKPIEPYDGLYSSDDEDLHNNQLVASESEDEGIYPFRRNRNCDYYRPHAEGIGNWPWESPDENGLALPKYRYNLTSLRLPTPRCIGFARRRMGRGGRIILDRASTNYDDIWARLDYTIFETNTASSESRLPEVIETKLFDSINVDTCVEDGSEKLLNQNPSVLNNHHNNNIVIKSENSKNHEISDDQMDVERSSGEVNNHKLDDFEQLLDSASASSNIINKKLVCRNNSDMSDDSFMLKSAGSDVLQKNLSVGLLSSLSGEASSSGVSSTNGSVLSNAADSSQQLDANKLVTIAEEEEEEELSKTEPPEDFYMSLMEEIKSEWLHFRPKTPPASDEILFDSDVIDKTKKFAVELQMLDGDYQETEMSSYTDHVYLTQPMTFDFNHKNLLTNERLVIESTSINVKTEPADEDEPMEVNEEPIAKPNSDAVKKLLEKYQNDVENEAIEIDFDDLNFDDLFSNNETLGCSKFNIASNDLIENFKQEEKETLNIKLDESANIVIKNEISDFSSNTVQTAVKEAPIAELQSHNYVLQYGSPVTPNTVTLSPLPNNTNIVCNDSGMSPATTLFQQQFINSGNAIISTAQQSQNKAQPIVYDSNTIVLAAAPNRKQLNGPTDRTLNQSKYKQVFMLDLTQGQDRRKSLGDNNVIKKTYADLGLGSQNILVSSVNSNLLTSNTNNLTQQSQPQQFSLVHPNSLQKPIILSTSSAGTLLQTSNAVNTGNKIIVTPSPQISGNVFVSSQGKLVIPSSNNSQSIILDSGKMITTNNQVQSQQKIQTHHQQRVKMDNKMNMMLENSGEKNIIYKYNKNKLLQTVASIIPMQTAANKSGVQATNQTVKQIPTVTSSTQSIGIISNNKTIQRIQQQQILRPQYGATSVNFQSSPTSSKIIQQPNNGNNILGSVNNNTDSNSQVNSTTPR